MIGLEQIEVDVDSIDGAGATIIHRADHPGDYHAVAYLSRNADFSTDEEWQYVVSALAAVLNDGTRAASELRAKARREVREFIGS